MSLKMNTIENIRSAADGKKGSVVVEAAVTLPIFIIAVMVMNSVILMYAGIEDCIFISASEMRTGAAMAAVSDSSAAIPYRSRKLAVSEHSLVSDARLTEYGYREERWNHDELIYMNLRLDLKAPGISRMNSEAFYDLSVVTRAYVGKLRDAEAMSASEMTNGASEAVFVFPARGERYHKRSCGFLTAEYTKGILDSTVRSRLGACPICDSGGAEDGCLIYYFPNAGDVYHLQGCSQLKREYIEMERLDALDRGYTPCAKCGG